MAESKLDQIRQLRERMSGVRGGYTGGAIKPEPPKTGSGVPSKEMLTAAYKKTADAIKEVEYGDGAKKLVCPVCEARRLKNLEAVRKHRAKKISKK